MEYIKVEPELFETYLLKQKNIKDIERKRIYNKNKVCYLSTNYMSGFCLTTCGRLCHVFSLQKGLGKLAVKRALALGANRLSCYNERLVKYYEDFGFKLTIKQGSKHFMNYKGRVKGASVCL